MDASLRFAPARLVGDDPGQPALAAAYARCARLTAAYSRSFSWAARLLPPAKRRAVHALYAFCRLSDDLVDSPAAQANPAAAAQALAAWRVYALGPAGDHDAAGPGRVAAPPPPVLPLLDAANAQADARAAALAFADARRGYAIPIRYAHQLLTGVGRDLACQRFDRFPQVAGYAYGVASTVGLMSMHIIGYRGPAARHAAQLGIALQLTNILRDVGEDLALGRLYLPTAELAAFGLRLADLTAGRITDRWRAFMRFQIERCQRLYASARPGIALLHPDGRLAVAAAAVFYRGILADIAAHDYDVFTRRAHVSALGKLARLPEVWWTARASPPIGRADQHPSPAARLAPGAFRLPGAPDRQPFPASSPARVPCSSAPDPRPARAVGSAGSPSAPDPRSFRDSRPARAACAAGPTAVPNPRSMPDALPASDRRPATRLPG